TTTLTITTTAGTTPSGTRNFTVAAGGSDTGPSITSNNFAFTLKSPTALSPVSGSGTFAGTAALTATLMSNSSPVSGKTVTFQLNGNPAGSGTTNASGVATVSGVSLTGINAGSYANAVSASFAEDSGFQASNGTGTLTVDKASSTTTVTVTNA